MPLLKFWDQVALSSSYIVSFCCIWSNCAEFLLPLKFCLLLTTGPENPVLYNSLDICMCMNIIELWFKSIIISWCCTKWFRSWMCVYFTVFDVGKYTCLYIHFILYGWQRAFIKFYILYFLYIGIIYHPFYSSVKQKPARRHYHI